MTGNENRTSADIVVVGAGVGGCLTALTIAEQNPDASVHVLAVQDERFDGHSGLIDVLGYSEAGQEPKSKQTLPSEPVSNPFSAFESLSDHHPYHVAGEESVRDALALFDEAVSAYCRGTDDRNGLLPVGNGRLSPALRYPASVQAGLLSRDEPMLLVGFDDLPQFDAELAAARLDEYSPYEVDGTTIELPVVLAEGATPTAVAHALDENESLRRVIAERIEEELDTQSRVGLPAVLGLTEAPAIRQEIQDECYAHPFEIPLGRPSVLGKRLQTQLFTALADAGVTVEQNCTVTECTVENGQVTELTLVEETYEAEAFVLATGGAGAGGIRATRDGQGHTSFWEPVFDCHVRGPDERKERTEDENQSRLSLTGQEFFDSQPFEHAGLQTDKQFRPLAADGTVHYENLRAVGGCLADIESTRRGSRDGIALTTGYVVGRELANEQ